MIRSHFACLVLRLPRVELLKGGCGQSGWRGETKRKAGTCTRGVASGQRLLIATLLLLLPSFLRCTLRPSFQEGSRSVPFRRASRVDAVRGVALEWLSKVGRPVVLV